MPHRHPLPRWAPATPGDQTVHVWMEHEGLAPRVQRRKINHHEQYNSRQRKCNQK